MTSMTPLSKRSRALSLTIAFALSLACGSGPSGGNAGGGIGGTGISRGTVNGFGSLIVNDIRWDVSSASFVRDGAPAVEGDIEIGMVVTIEGDQTSMTEGTATSVEFRDSIEGPIDATNDLGDGRVEVTIFNTVVVVENGRTVFDDSAVSGPFDFDSLAASLSSNLGDIVEVSGYDETPIANSRIVATRIERRGSAQMGSSVEMRGVVSGLFINSFTLNGISVTFSAGTDQVSGGIRNGAAVEVQGTLGASPFTSIVATRITDDDDSLGTNVAMVELEGIVSNFNSVTQSFQVDSQLVDYAGLAVLPPFGNGALVEVEGPIINGILLAAEVKVEDEDHRVSAEIENAIDIDVGNGTIVLLDNITVQTDLGTQFEDDRDEVPNFGLASLQAGDYIEVRGRRTGPSTLLATHLERDGSDDVRLRGSVQSITIDPTLSMVTILGVQVGFNNATSYEASDGSTILRPEFEALLELGLLLDVEDQSSDKANIAPAVTQIEVEGSSIAVDASVANANAIDAMEETITLLGIVIQTDSTTEYTDSVGGNPSFQFGDIAANDFLRIRGARSGPDSILAREIERDSPDDITIRGRVQDFTIGSPTSQLDLFGIPIEFDDSTTFFDDQGSVLSRAAFQNALDIDDFIEVTDDSGDPTTLAVPVSDLEYLDAVSAAASPPQVVQAPIPVAPQSGSTSETLGTAASFEWEGLDSLSPESDWARVDLLDESQDDFDPQPAPSDEETLSDRELLRTVVEVMARLLAGSDEAR